MATTGTSTLLKNDNGALFSFPESLKAQCIRIHGWRDDFAERALHGYRQFMKLKLQHEDWEATILSPSYVVDLVWHQHLLNPKQYFKACKRFTQGHIIDHNPDGGLDAKQRKKRIMSTELSLRALFGKSNIDKDIWAFWVFENNGNSKEDPFVIRSENKKRGRMPEELVTISLRQEKCYKVVVTYYKLAKSTAMIHVFDHYTRWTGVRGSSVRFLFRGKRVDAMVTPLLLDLDEGGCLDVMMEQTGC